jgi:hypothetical protein
MYGTRLIGLSLAVTLLASPVMAGPQPANLFQHSKSKKQSIDSQSDDALAKAKADLISASKDYKASLEKLITFNEENVKSAQQTFDKRKQLLEAGVVSRREVEQSQHALEEAQSKLDATKRQIAEADNMIAEAVASEQMLKMGRLGAGAYRATAALIRYNGLTAWSLKDAGQVESFFASKFGHAMPISAFGQTAVHDHLGFDHRNAMDVAVNPDSHEGQALMTYLRSLGIPFIAFRRAVAGSATGAHIHIGSPSHRTSSGG